MRKDRELGIGPWKARIRLAVVGVAVLAAIAVVVLLIAGCTSPAQQRLAIADVAAQAEYIRQAQPAVEGYCDALAASGYPERAGQLRADTRGLATTLTQNGATRLDALRVENQAVEAARAALDVATAILEQLEKGTANVTPTSQPASN